MRVWLLAPVIGAILLACPVAAQNNESVEEAESFKLSGTSRLRYEAIGGQARAGSNEADDLVNLRTTVRAQYESAPITAVAELWDSRVYGDRPGTPVTTGEVNTLELVQAYVEARAPDLLGEGTTASLQAGRFLLNLGSRRLVAADDYRNTTNGYTGLRADVSLPEGWRRTLIYTLPQQRRPDDFESLRDNEVAVDQEGFDLVLWGGLVSRTRAIGPVLAEASFFHLGERDTPSRPSRDRSLNTASVRLIRDPAPGKVDFEVEGIVQRGNISANIAPGAPTWHVSAWFVHGDIGYTFAGDWRPRVALEYDHASGDKPGGRYGRFDTLFGMRRADLGPAGLYNAFGRANFISPGLRAEVTPSTRTDAFATIRPVWLAARQDSFSTTGVRDPTGRSGNFAGTQVDARIRHRLSEALQLELDAVLLAKGRFLREAPNAPPGRWTRYVSVNATVTF
jgi:hypothetical protein